MRAKNPPMSTKNRLGPEGAAPVKGFFRTQRRLKKIQRQTFLKALKQQDG